MDNQRVVVILLLITIILSVFSVILTFTVNARSDQGSASIKAGQIENPESLFKSQSGQASLGIEAPPAA